MYEKDPEVEELLAGHRERKSKEQQARHDVEYPKAAGDTEAVRSEMAREILAAEKRVAAKREARLRAVEEEFAEAAALDNRKSDWHGTLLHLSGIMARTMPAIWRQAKADLEERIAAERHRVIGPEEGKSALHNGHVAGLLAARDALDGLIGSPVEEMPRRIARILGAVPSRYDGGPVKVKSYIETQAAGIREYIKSRFNDNNT